MVTELLVLGFIVFVLVGSMSFYFYSRMMYVERKINLLETILLDIKMTMEMEDSRVRDEFVEYGQKQAGSVIINDLSGTPVEGEELATQAEFYNMVLEGAPAAALPEDVDQFLLGRPIQVGWVVDLDGHVFLSRPSS